MNASRYKKQRDAYRLMLKILVEAIEADDRIANYRASDDHLSNALSASKLSLAVTALL
jgi:hypothetical protein